MSASDRRSINPLELDRLLASLCDGTLGPDELRALGDLITTDAWVRQRYLEYLDLHASLLGQGPVLELPALQEPTVTQAPPSPRHYRSRLVFLFGGLAAAVLVALGLWAAFAPRKVPPDPSREPDRSLAGDRLVELQGQIEVRSPTGDWEEIAVGAEIEAGRTVRTGSEDSFAVVELADRTRLEMGADTQVRLAEDAGGRRLVLSTGFLHAEVRQQPRDRPLVVTTPQAEVEVRGTRFTVSVVSPSVTEVVTEAGAVQVTRLADGSRVEVPAGFSAVAGAPTQPMAVSRIPQSPAEPRLRFDFADAIVLAFSPDGSKLLAASPQKYALLDVRTGKALAPPARHGHENVKVLGGADAKTLTYRDKDGRVSMRDIETRQTKKLVETGLDREWVIAAAPDGSEVAAGSTARLGETIRRWRPEDGSELMPWTVPSRVICLAYAPNSKRLAAGLGVALKDRVARIGILDMGGGDPTILPVPGQCGVRMLAFSADGQRLVGASERGEVYLWDVPRKTLLAVRDATDGWTWPVNALAFSPNGRILAVGGVGGRVRLWDTTTNRNLLLPLGGGGNVRALAFSPDGRSLAVGMVQNNAVTLWDVPPGLPEP